MNTVNIIGRITKTPELRNTDSGIAVTNFTLAVDRDYTSKEQERQTDFFTVVAWRQTAVFAAKYLTTGIRIGVTGKLENRQYTDKNGIKRTVTEIIADKFDFADGKKDAGAQPNSEKAPEPSGSPARQITDDYTASAAFPEDYTIVI